VGSNAGVKSAEVGHYYSHRNNKFWTLLHSSGCTPRKLLLQEDQSLPSSFRLGLTDLVARPTRSESDLAPSELLSGWPGLEAKIRRYKPYSVCIMGKGNWGKVCKARRTTEGSGYGWQDASFNIGSETSGGYAGARVFVAPHPAGSDTSMKAPEKAQEWKRLGEVVSERRSELQ
jgi:TDG/mug DNA glycosylase family protein